MSYYTKSIWKLLSAEYVNLNEAAVPLLINSIIYESGRTTFWNLVEKDFKDSSWKVRMQAGSLNLKLMIVLLWTKSYLYRINLIDSLSLRNSKQNCIFPVLRPF